MKVEAEVPITAIEFHPDGLVLGVGLQNGDVIIYDIRTQEKAITLNGPIKEGASTFTGVRQIQFSNKGFHLAVAWEDQDICRVYSMHKQNQFVDVKMQGLPVQSICFDHYG